MTDTPYILHYAPDNASFVIRLALDHVGQPYTTALVDRRARAQNSDAYRAVNPNGLIPTLETPDGPIFETAAILLWLADRHGGLGPAPDAPQRADFLKWLFFMSNTLHPALRRMFYAQTFVGDDQQYQRQLRTMTKSQIVEHLRVLEERWQSGPAPALALKLYLAPMIRWLALYPRDADHSWFKIEAYPALFSTVKALESDQTVTAACAAEGLGPFPFTAPQPPMPPEGSAI